MTSDGDPSGIPGDPGYDPHWDPNVSEPEVPVPGLDPTVPIVDHTGDPNWVAPNYPDEDAPVDPTQVVKNLNASAMYLALFTLNGVPDAVMGATDQRALKRMIRAYVIMQLSESESYRAVQYQVIDRTGPKERWMDPSLDAARSHPGEGVWPADWNGVMNAELQVRGGMGAL